jgi:hypothetical protein
VAKGLGNPEENGKTKAHNSNNKEYFTCLSPGESSEVEVV